VKRHILRLLFASIALSGQCQQADWLTDAQAAQDKARQENKCVLLDFTGSDWCGWCMKLKAEVFDKPGFAQLAGEKLVLVEVDFPHHKALDDAQKHANERLAVKYGITGFPTLVVLGPDGRFLGRTGYVPGGPQAFNPSLERILQTARPVSAVAGNNDDKPEPPRKPAAFVPIPPAAPMHYGALTLKSISGTKERRLALINNETLMVGETRRVKSRDVDVVVLCKEIREDSVLITADGKPMELKFQKH
jgi:protein disulfide-isomerase